MNEMRVGTRELKSRLSEYLRRVKSGQTIIVTERGTAIGQIIPLKPSLEERLQAMVSAGIAEWNGHKLKPYRPAAVNRGERQVSDLVVEGRE
ncbi:MAG: type II toxin-antitoxin system prevent-host-death family antitoxin [Anaerolineales bacterium]|nr:type II toxin-antitoxin system prevent-host-death family antitoxin [Anaerolineales bacterium]